MQSILQILRLALYCFIFICLDGVRCTESKQIPLGHNKPNPPPRKLGIIGAGPAGISAARHAHKWAKEANINVNITILTSGYGRTLTAIPYGSQRHHLWSQWLESGSYGFNLKDRIFGGWVDELGLETVPAFSSRLKDENWYLGEDRVVFSSNDTETHFGVWDGQRFVVNTTTGYNHWEAWWRDVFQHKEATAIIENLVRDAHTNFSRLYDAPVFPFTELNEVIKKVGLEEILRTPAFEYLQDQGIDRDIINKVLMPAMRRSRGSVLREFGTSLPALMASTTEMPLKPRWGLWGLFLQLCSDITTMDCKYYHRVSHIARPRGHDVFALSRDFFGRHVWHSFDELIIAAPYSETNVQFLPPLENGGPPDTFKTYNSMWTSFIATSHTLNPEFFGLPEGAKLPNEILTTCADEICSPRDTSVLSIVRLGIVQRPADDFDPPADEPGPPQNLYQLSTAEQPGALLLMQLFSGPNVTSSSKPTFREGSDKLYNQCDPEAKALPISRSDISWFCSHGWHHASPVPLMLTDYERLPPIKLDDHIWYTSGMENIDSSMEAAALMGANVARLIVDGWINGTQRVT